MRVGVIFPGQGNQTPGFGRAWVDSPAWGVVESAERAVGEPLRALLLDATGADLGRTREAQLAVLLSSLVVWRALDPLLAASGHEIVAFAGHSLGQITALVAAGALPEDAGARVARSRADLTQRAADRRPGRMVALLGVSEADVATVCAAAPGACWLASVNAPGQVVVAGTPAGVDAAVAAATSLGIDDVVPLDVAGAFHTPLMSDAADALAGELGAVRFAPLRAPVISNTDGRAYGADGDWPGLLRQHLVRPVQWQACMETVADLGVDIVVEVGPGTTLRRLAKRICPGVAVRSVATPADVAALVDGTRLTD